MAFKKKDGRWCESFVHEGKRHFVYARNKSELPKKISEKMQALQTKQLDHDNPVLDDYHDAFVEIRRLSVKESTLRSYHYLYKDSSEVILPSGIRLGDLRMRDVRPADIKFVQMALVKKGSSDRTINGVLTHLSDMFKAAVKDETIIKNPCEAVDLVKDHDRPLAKNTIHRALSVDETRLFFTNASDSYYFNLFRLMIQTGMRLGELGALTHSDIGKDSISISKTVSRGEYGSYVINSSPKNSSSTRLIPITPIIRDILDEQKKFNKCFFGMQLVPRLFNLSNGGILREYPVNREIARICSACGIDKFTSHCFRDTFATRFIEQRPMDYKVLSDILGHANIKHTLNLYAHVMQDTKAAAMDALAISM